MSSSSEGAKVSKKSLKKSKASRKKSGFTILEVMLVLALTGMLMLGVLGGTFSSIRTQRYNDSVRSFAEFLRTVYSEVISPESLGAGTSGSYAILGKVIVFGIENGGYNGSSDASNVYTATLVGNADIPSVAQASFIEELADANTKIYCGQPIGTDNLPPSSVAHYELPWQAELMYAKQDYAGLDVSDLDKLLDTKFSGTVIIARAPSSGAVHTIFTSKVYDIAHECQYSSGGNEPGASYELNHDLAEYLKLGTKEAEFAIQDIGFCIKSENSTLMREVRIAADGRNTSAISIINTDELEDGERNNCR